MSVFDSLAEGLDEVSTAEPILAPSIYTFKLHSIEKKTAESGFEYLALGLQLMDEGQDIDGNPIGTVFLNTMLGLTPNEYNTEDAIKREVCKFLDCFQGSRDWDETLESYKGLEGTIKTKVEKERTNKNTGVVYPQTHAVAQYLPKED